MAATNWTTNDTIIQGDLSIILERGRVYSSYVEFNLYAYSQKWGKINVALEYRTSKYNEWQTDMEIVSTLSDYITGNKVYGLLTAADGHLNKIIWNYPKNYIKNGDIPDVRVRVLPTLVQFSGANHINILTKAYGENKVDVIDKTNIYRVIGINNEGQYIAAISQKMYILDSLDSSPVYTYTGVATPLHATQVYSGNYIVADTGNNRVIELDSTLSTIQETHAVLSPQFVYYSEDNDVLLITARDPDIIYEVSWSPGDIGTALWNSTATLKDPSCATYSRSSQDKIIISDTGNNRLVIYNRVDDEYTNRGFCTYRSGDILETKIIHFNRPFRAYQLYDEQICIIEERGLQADFDILGSSSSSSSSIDSSSSSSVGYSSSSSMDSSSSSSIGYSSSSSSEGYSSSSSLGESSSSSSLGESSSSSGGFSSSSSSVGFSSSSSSVGYSSSSSSIGYSSSSSFGYSSSSSS